MESQACDVYSGRRELPGWGWAQECVCEVQPQPEGGVAAWRKVVQSSEVEVGGEKPKEDGEKEAK